MVPEDQVRGGIRRLVRRVLGSEEHYRSPQEIALRNAADSLGVTLGEDYFDDLDLNEIQVDLPGTANSARTDAFREELVAYIEGRSIERKRRRRVRALKIGIAGLAVAGSAVVLGAEIRHDEPSRLPKDARLSLPKYARNGIGVSRAGPHVTTTMPAVGGGKLVHSAYRDLRENVCSSTARVAGGITLSEGRGGCVPPEELAEAISRRSSFFAGYGGASRYMLVDGYGRSDLERLVADDSQVRIESTISAAWHPGGSAPDGSTMKIFLVRIWYGPGVRFGSIMDLSSHPQSLGLTAVFADGKRAPVLSFEEALHGPKPPTQIIDPIRKPMKIMEDCVVVDPGEKLPAGKTRC